MPSRGCRQPTEATDPTDRDASTRTGAGVGRFGRLGRSAAHPEGLQGTVIAALRNRLRGGAPRAYRSRPSLSGGYPPSRCHKRGEQTDANVHTQFSIGCSRATGALFACLVVFLLFAAMEAFLGKTPGKFAVSTRVVDEDGDQINLVSALVRNALRFVDGIAFYIVGLVIVAIDGENRRLGDMLAKIRVVND